jgi:pyrimidine operon attenuation protein/uracil phosphoribosyltransferase
LQSRLTPTQLETMVLVGIHTGGYWLAQKLHADMGFNRLLKY